TRIGVGVDKQVFTGLSIKRTCVFHFWILLKHRCGPKEEKLRGPAHAFGKTTTGKCGVWRAGETSRRGVRESSNINGVVGNGRIPIITVSIDIPAKVNKTTGSARGNCTNN